MTLQQLFYSVKIAETKSMNKAAAELFISQPALSSAIHELEEELGIQIFIRNQRGVIVTIEGENFLSYARHIVEVSNMLKERMKQIELSIRKKFHKVLFSRFAKAINEYELIKEHDHIAVLHFGRKRFNAYG